MVYEYGFLKGNEACQHDDSYVVPSKELKQLTLADPSYSVYVLKAYCINTHANTVPCSSDICMSAFSFSVNCEMTIRLIDNHVNAYVVILRSC